MKFSRSSVEVLIDLVEIKISNLIVQDKEDNKELQRLRQCKDELQKLITASRAQENTVSQSSEAR